MMFGSTRVRGVRGVSLKLFEVQCVTSVIHKELPIFQPIIVKLLQEMDRQNGDVL
ncbi:hypothetical protein [Candidatus Parabeggiatoa sp. HSG14]|uniref:hypothetical protein n=1 Tax=Candidatus Parabeggiatoa sp. HSG14 TaxID=3055593 RepID=UPI0025A8D0AD|nr:hypothetical protein [Thiotrichales bacterium HSG14]